MRLLREDAGIGTRALGRAAGMSPGVISYYENGKRDLTLDGARRLAEALDVPLMALVDPLGVKIAAEAS